MKKDIFNNKKIWAVTALIQKDGKVLACSRRNKPTEWGLPGGKIDPGETPLQAIIRELEEETTIKALDAQAVFFRPVEPNPLEVVCYRISNWKGSPFSVENGVFVEWKYPIELIQGPFGSWNQKLFDSLGIHY